MTITMSGEGRARRLTTAGHAPVTEAARLRLEVAQLKDKLAGQPVIEQAKGMLMQTFGLSPEHAFDTLRIISQESNVRLREVARCIVEFGTRHGPRPEFEAAADFLVTLRDGLRVSHHNRS